MLFTSAKTLLAAASLVVCGTFASAATIAEITVDGDYAITSAAGSDGLRLDGSYSALLDPTFNPNATNDFMFDLQLEIDGLAAVNEQVTVAGVTGNDIAGFAIGLLSDVDLAFPGSIAAILAEASDADGVQTEVLPNLFFSLDLSLDSVVGNTGFGGFSVILTTNNPFNPLDRSLQVVGAGNFNGSATISTVAAVPLPAGGVLLLSGLVGVAGLNRCKKKVA